MSPDIGSQRAFATRPLVAARRSPARYAIEMDLRYKVSLRGQILEEGVGKTIHLSTEEILVRCGKRLHKGLAVELSIDWPVPLEGSCPLQLRVEGKIAGSSEAGMVVRIMRHEFCTRRKRAGAAGAAPGNCG